MRSRLARWAPAAVLAALGCGWLPLARAPAGIERWQTTATPRLSLAEKADAYQERLEARHQRPDGILRPTRGGRDEPNRYGNEADGSFYLGIHLASQALRLAATGEPAAREQIGRALAGMRLLAEVSGQRGLLARYAAPEAPPDDPRWRPSPTVPGYFWRSDVSKDQYAGFVHGLGVALAVLPDPELRAQLAELAGPLADHLIEHDLDIVDWDGERTTYGDLQGRRFGVPIGVNALIALAVARVAVVATGEARHRELWERLLRDGYPGVAYWAHFSLPWFVKRVNDNMGYLAIYPLLLLAADDDVAEALHRSERRSWSHVRGEGNAFFAFVHAALVASRGDASEAADRTREQAIHDGRRGLREFPDRKVPLPVDLTRPHFAFPRAFFLDDGWPRSRRPVPLHLRPIYSHMWVNDPFELVGQLDERGDKEYVGLDYLQAYWMGRYHGFVAADE